MQEPNALQIVSQVIDNVDVYPHTNRCDYVVYIQRHQHDQCVYNIQS